MFALGVKSRVELFATLQIDSSPLNSLSITTQSPRRIQKVEPLICDPILLKALYRNPPF